MLRQGTGEPLLLLHGILGSERMWGSVVPFLSASHDVIAPTLLGHHGGAPATTRPARLEHLVDDVERLLGRLELERAHIAGNSLGGWIALELARRGRALSVCAFSPAGAWESGEPSAAKRPRVLLATIRDTRRSRPLLGLLGLSAGFRRWALRNTALHGERVSRSEFLGLADDTLGCQVGEELLRSSDQLAPLDPAPCPITLAWSAQDRIFPVDVNGIRAQQLIPDARFRVLESVGHVPMLDNPKLVAETILGASAEPRSRD